ncbi:uncharacterized protein LOC116194480 [Punica granatum]|uniref:Uncharacterized protein n=2 Tax=Punica granatum TaxID=22663 RepID=A0A218X3E1_PUNGR|nr:uncharacterized protein LOC116194480 [Punica granatum]OWM79229.1 hypothetical protein CDL15_Pgr003401 [Punica granatum]PKI33563.1 hypothetical protein CRG98_046119 [Punica granatum]
MFKISEQEGTGAGGCGGSFFTNPTLISPRISFSHDFVDAIHPELRSYKEAPVSSDFEFSVKNNTMIPADEIFVKGMLVPSREDDKSRSRTSTTLRDELLVGDDDGDTSNQDAFSGWSGRWIDRWALKKGNHHLFGSKKGGKRSGSFDGMPLETVVEEKGPKSVNVEAPLITSKEQKRSSVERRDDASVSIG